MLEKPCQAWLTAGRGQVLSTAVRSSREADAPRGWRSHLMPREITRRAPNAINSQITVPLETRPMMTDGAQQARVAIVWTRALRSKLHRSTYFVVDERTAQNRVTSRSGSNGGSCRHACQAATWRS